MRIRPKDRASSFFAFLGKYIHWEAVFRYLQNEDFLFKIKYL